LQTARGSPPHANNARTASGSPTWETTRIQGKGVSNKEKEPQEKVKGFYEERGKGGGDIDLPRGGERRRKRRRRREVTTKRTRRTFDAWCRGVMPP
jgi:hypothetical protein